VPCGKDTQVLEGVDQGEDHLIPHAMVR
jgi:hypothetical protein